MLPMSILTIMYLYAIGGVVAGRAAYADDPDRMRAALAAACWPLAPTRWLTQFIAKRFR